MKKNLLNVSKFRQLFKFYICECLARNVNVMIYFFDFYFLIYNFIWNILITSCSHTRIFAKEHPQQLISKINIQRQLIQIFAYHLFQIPSLARRPLFKLSTTSSFIVWGQPPIACQWVPSRGLRTWRFHIGGSIKLKLRGFHRENKYFCQRLLGLICCRTQTVHQQ